MACVAAPIIGGPRPPPAQRRTHPTPPKNPIGPAYHTLKCEEPLSLARRPARLRGPYHHQKKSHLLSPGTSR